MSTTQAAPRHVPFKRFGYRYHWRNWFGGVDTRWHYVWFRREAHRDQALEYQLQQKTAWERVEAERAAKNPNYKAWEYSHQDMEKVNR